MNTKRHPECEWLEEHIDAWVCGDLAPEDTARIDAHLATCPACAEHAAEAREFDGALAALPMESCPDAVLERAFSQVDRETARSRGAWRLAPALAAAAVLLVACGAFLFTQRGGEDPPYTPEELARAERELAGVIGYIAHAGANSVAAAFEETADIVSRARNRAVGMPPPAAKTAQHVRRSLADSLRDIGYAGRDGLGSAREQFMEVDAIASFSGTLRALRDASPSQNNPTQGD